MKTSMSQIEARMTGNETAIFFPEGIIGFTEQKQYTIVSEKSKRPFFWLQSVEDGGPSFIVIDPREFQVDYQSELSAADKAVLRVDNIEECEIFAIVSVPKDSDKISANLLAPLVVNKKENLGKQIVLQYSNYAVQHLILEEMLKTWGEKDVGSFAQTK